jgi:hypothetical protein
MSNPLRSEHVRAIITELARVGITPTIAYTGRTHIKIAWCANGKTEAVFTCGTPSDRRTRLNDRAMIRRKLREAKP